MALSPMNVEQTGMLQHAKTLSACASLGLAAFSFAAFQGCSLAAAGKGAEAGYVMSQEDRTATETVTDQRITAAIKTRMLSDSRVAGLDINVDTFKAQVTLRGAVKSEQEADAAVALAESVSGVKRVASKLAIMP
jgi:hypothetical protein